MTDHLCDNIALVSTPCLQNTIACYCSYLDAACIWRPALRQLCLDLGLSEAGRGAPRQVSVGTQSIIDRSPRLRLLCWSQVSESWGWICLKFTAYDKMGCAEMSFCLNLWTRKINVENRRNERDFHRSILEERREKQHQHWDSGRETAPEISWKRWNQQVENTFSLSCEKSLIYSFFPWETDKTDRQAGGHEKQTSVRQRHRQTDRERTSIFVFSQTTGVVSCFTAPH